MVVYRYDEPTSTTFREIVLLPNAHGLLAGAARGLQVSRDNVLEHLILKRESGNKALQTDVLPFQFLHPFRLIKFKPAVFLQPSR
jgi:hypothetical protein